MHEPSDEILVWLPSPMGDAILCTPALRAIRKRFERSRIAFLANRMVRQTLSPCRFNDIWIDEDEKNPFSVARDLRKHRARLAILLKNSFSSALAIRLAGIPSRIGYARDSRGFLLTDRLYAPKLPNGGFKPISMVDYYLALAAKLGADTSDRSLELSVEPKDKAGLLGKLPNPAGRNSPIAVIVPGGAFGPSKCWPAERFAQTADWLVEKYGMNVVLSVAPNEQEKRIADAIIAASRHALVNLHDRPVTIGELKALFSIAELVVTNDTGPRHIAIALRRKVVSLFGPNDPAWTDTGYEKEIQIIGNAHCAPCRKPTCRKDRHLCMEAISVETVCRAAAQLLEGKRANATIIALPNTPDAPRSFFVHPDYKAAFDELGLTSIDAVFSFSAGKDPGGSILPKHRSRLQFSVSTPPRTLFLKRYNRPGPITQVKNWLWQGTRKSMMSCDLDPVQKLAAAGIQTPRAIAWGEQWGILFEKRSFLITEEITGARPLEERLPECFRSRAQSGSLHAQRQFIRQLAQFTKRFHETGCRHRDFYLCHIFHADNGVFYLIDLQRVFKPHLFAERFRVKDIAQLSYSAPGSVFTRTDRLRFYRAYADKDRLDHRDRTFIKKVLQKMRRMARHDAKHNLAVPFTH